MTTTPVLERPQGAQARHRELVTCPTCAGVGALPTERTGVLATVHALVLARPWIEPIGRPCGTCRGDGSIEVEG